MTSRDSEQLWSSAAGRIGTQIGQHVEIVATPHCSENITCNVVLAIDDLSLDNCLYTHEDFGCNFDNFGDDGSENKDTYCLWKQDQEDDIDWHFIAETNGNGENFGYIILSNEHEEAENGALESIILPPNQKYCFSFKYKMYGDNIGNLRVVMKSNDSQSLEPIVVWQRLGSQGNKWIQGQAQFTPAIPVSLVVEGNVHGEYSPILLDDLSLILGSCPDTPVCGFEDGNNGWVQKGEIKWTKGTGMNTQGLGFTPDHDHTTKSDVGHFMYLDPRGNIGKAAILQYKKQQNTSRCLNFWYTSQDNDGFLQVREKYIDGIGNNRTESMWEKPKYSLPSWQMAQVSLEPKPDMKGYKIQIYGSVGTRNTSVMAIDDLELLDGSCPPFDHCSFERGTCGYGNWISDDFDWIIFSSSEVSLFNAPPLDKTLESTEGHSFIAHLGGHRIDQSATFMTSLIPKQYRCLVFW